MKSLLFYLASILFPTFLAAQSCGAFHPQKLISGSCPGFSQSWSDPDLAGASDDKYASFANLTGSVGDHTDYLTATNFNLNVPDGTTITGILVEIERSDPNSRTSDYSIRIIRNGIICGNEHSTDQAYPVSDAYQSYGGSGDKWGQEWDYKKVDNYDFGVAISAQRNANGGITAGQIDDIRVTVFYNFITLPVNLLSFTASKSSKSVLLNWKTVQESNMEKYIVERSENGFSFSPLTNITAHNQQSANYSFVDANPVTGISYYRLKMEGVGGYQKYSQIVSVSFTKENLLALFPSPWNKEAALNITNDNNEKLLICFYSMGGQLLSTATTETKQVPTETLANRKGLLYYKVFDDKKNLLGSGNILVL